MGRRSRRVKSPPRYAEEPSSSEDERPQKKAKSSKGSSKSQGRAKDTGKQSGSSTKSSSGRSTLKSSNDSAQTSLDTQATSVGSVEEEKRGGSDKTTPIDDILEDFKKSYVGTLTFDEPERPPTPKWQIPDEPIHDPKKTPQGWTPIDNHVDKNDVNALIQRCRERIAEKIMPNIFEQELNNLLQRKKEEDALIRSEPTGLSWNVVKRLNELKQMQKWLEEKGDECRFLPTIKAIMKAYRTKKLAWNLGLVTYWKDGKQICQPRIHDMQVVSTMVQDPRFKTGFWVEGSRLAGPLPPGPTNLNAQAGNHYRLYPNSRDQLGTGHDSSGEGLCYEPTANEGPFQVKMNMKLRFADPNSAYWEFEFSDDSGSDFMTIYRDDVFTLYNINQTIAGREGLVPGSVHLGNLCPVLGIAQSFLGDGSSSFSYVVPLCFNLEHCCPEMDNQGFSWLDMYHPIEVLVRDGNIQGARAPRLNGPALRWIFNTATCSTDMIRLYVLSTMRNGVSTYVKKPLGRPLQGHVKQTPTLQHTLHPVGAAPITPMAPPTNQ